MPKKYWLILAAGVVLAGTLFVKPVLLGMARHELKGAFPDSQVAIERLDFSGLRTVRLSNVSVRKTGMDVKVREVRLELFPWQIFVQGAWAEGPNFNVEEASINVGPKLLGQMSIESVQYNKLRLTNLTSTTALNGENLFLENFTAEVLKGRVEGNVTVKIAKIFEYSAQLNFAELDLQTFINDFKFDEKLQLTGSLGGYTDVKGKGPELEILNGGFSTASHGGELVIKDARFLQNLAADTHQPLNIIVDSLRNYHYNNGIMKLSLDSGNIVLQAHLESEQGGKRDFTLTLHDINLQ